MDCGGNMVLLFRCCICGCLLLCWWFRRRFGQWTISWWQPVIRLVAAGWKRARLHHQPIPQILHPILNYLDEGIIHCVRCSNDKSKSLSFLRVDSTEWSNCERLLLLVNFIAFYGRNAIKSWSLLYAERKLRNKQTCQIALEEFLKIRLSYTMLNY